MVRLTFDFDLPESLKQGDNVFYVNDRSEAVLLGPLTEIIDRSILVDADPGTVRPDIGESVLFAPNRSIEQSGIIGYEGTCTFINDSTERAELFAVSSEVFESSR